MVTEIKSWQIVDGKLVSVTNSLSEAGRREKDDLEKWIKSNPAILGEDIAIIGEQVQTASGPMDFLGVDNSGNIIVVELKRDRLPREALVQAIDYASDVADWDLGKFREICENFTKMPFEEYFQQKFSGINLEDLAINQAQRLLLVGFSIDESLGRMIEWLSDKYNVGINAVLLKYVKTKNGDEILSRTVIIPEEIEKQKANKKKFIIETSDEPGTYDEKNLEEKLVGYLTKNLWSAQRMRDYVLPILLEKGQVTRDFLRKEFVKRGVAPDESQAGYYLSLISGQLGYKWNDYLRQIISYSYPNHPWEKDNFNIRDEYRELIRKVLENIKTKKQK